MGINNASVFAGQGMPAFNGKLATSVSLYILSYGDILQECLNPGSNIEAWYNGDSYIYSGDANKHDWIDMSANNNGIFYTAASAFDDSKNIMGQRIYEDVAARQIEFPLALQQVHTVFNVARYTPDGASQLRILTANPDNGLFGFWSGLTGVAYEDGWITSNLINQFDHQSWLISSQQKDLYRGNFQDFTVNTQYQFNSAN